MSHMQETDYITSWVLIKLNHDPIRPTNSIKVHLDLIVTFNHQQLVSIMHQMISKLDDCNAANMQIFSIRVITFFLTYIDLVASFNRQSIQLSVDSHHQLVVTKLICR